jgi:AbiJ N-terminal domain 4
VSDSDFGGPRPPTFSEQYGYEDYPTAIQHEDLDEDSRTNLWNYIVLKFLEKNPPPIRLDAIWASHLRRPVNYFDVNTLYTEMERTVRSREFNKVFDLVQYLVQNVPRGSSTSKDFNRMFARNRVGWRIIEEHIVPITNDSELQSITTATYSSTATATHIKNALALMANRESPNFAKSIQESISAAEAAAQELAGIRKPLGEALDAYKKNSSALHPALITGWKNLYGFTSDSGGIRHAGFDGAIQPTQELAQYFLVTCSAFVNLVTSLKSQQTT